MAIRGARPKPGHLRAVDGTHRNDRHGEKPAAPVDSPICMAKPKALKGAASKAWDKWIAQADWLDWSKEPSATAFCYLWAEFIASPDDFQSTRHAQMRAYMSELGLTDERNRGEAKESKPDPGAKYFA